MGLITCPACERSRIVEPILRGSYWCRNCGSHAAIIIRRRKTWQDWSERDGLDYIEARRQTFAGLAWFAAEKGYELPGWARIKFRTLFGCWPDDTIEQSPPAPIRRYLMRWIEKQNARFSAQRRKEREAFK